MGAASGVGASLPALLLASSILLSVGSGDRGLRAPQAGPSLILHVPRPGGWGPYGPFVALQSAAHLPALEVRLRGGRGIGKKGHVKRIRADAVAEEVEEPKDSPFAIDEERVNVLLRRQVVSAKTERRKLKRKQLQEAVQQDLTKRKQQPEAVQQGLGMHANYDPRKRSGVEWVEMQGQSWSDMHRKVHEGRARADEETEKKETPEAIKARSKMHRQVVKAAGLTSDKASALARRITKEMDSDTEWDPAAHDKMMKRLGKASGGKGEEEEGEKEHPFEGEEISGLSDEDTGGGWRPKMGTGWEEEVLLGAEGGGDEAVEWECETCEKRFAKEKKCLKHEARCALRTSKATAETSKVDDEPPSKKKKDKGKSSTVKDAETKADRKGKRSHAESGVEGGEGSSVKRKVSSADSGVGSGDGGGGEGRSKKVRTLKEQKKDAAKAEKRAKSGEGEKGSNGKDETKGSTGSKDSGKV
ncbi:hypothetical protein T484DRAFT_1886041 [Baffinella frigidus]|nr:hypothetical protein T484DRAFT_1886041 [Cryptophyta sp. CCMP2293]